MQLQLIVCILICTIQTAKIPSNFKKCNRNDPSLGKCLLAAVKDALPQLDRPYPEINLPNMNPLHVSELGATTEKLFVNMDERLYNCTFYGFTEGKPEQFQWDLQNKKMRVKVRFPKIETWCTYEIDGRILFFIIHSGGPSHVLFTNFVATYDISYKEVIKDGKTYVDIVDSKFEGTIENVHFDLENIFPGFSLLTQFTNSVLNLFWRLLLEEVKDGYFEMMDKKVLRPIFDGFFEAVSLEDALD